MNRPLVVDLDGTLLRSDILLESILSYVKRGLGETLLLPVWLMKGKAFLKEQLAARINLPLDILPYNKDLLEFLCIAKKQYRMIILATATHKIHAEQIAKHLGLFDLVIATENGINLSSHFKRDRLIKEFGEKGFDYIGISHADITVWKAAEKAYLCDPEIGVQKKMKSLGNIQQVFITRINTPKSFLTSLRPHQWLKNLLIFIPILAAHQFTRVNLIGISVLAFALFSLTASSGYINYQIILQQAKIKLGVLDIVLIAHGTLANQKMCEADPMLTVKEIQINTLSIISLLTDIANMMEMQHHGTIAVISSITGDRGRPSNYVYGTAKAAVTTFCEGLRVRLYKNNVHLLTIKPGIVDTPMTDGIDAPNILVAKPDQIATDIINAIERKKDVLYTPWFWKYIMLIIIHLPVKNFKNYTYNFTSF